MLYLLAPDTLQTLREAESSPRAPTAAESAAHIRAASRREVKVTNGTASVRVHGVLTKQPSLLALLFGPGNSTYADIAQELRDAELDPAVRDVVLDVDSPGGQVDGLFDLLGQIESFKKPIRARASNAMSAAYAIAAATGRIEATAPAAAFGSVGVVASFWVSASIVDVASSEAPKKRPDVRTEEGRGVVREYLDQIHELFVGAIARGRRTTSARVNSDFGRGGIVLAERALRAGMIDSVAGRSAPSSIAKSADGAGEKIGLPSSEGEPKAAGPDMGDAVVAILEAQRGKSRKSQATPAPVADSATPDPAPERSSQQPDQGDAIVAILEQRRGARPREEPSTNGEPSSPNRDIAEQLVAAIDNAVAPRKSTTTTTAQPSVRRDGYLGIYRA